MIWLNYLKKYLSCKNSAHSFDNLQKVQKGQVGMSLSSVSRDVHVLVESFTSYAVLHVKQSFIKHLSGHLRSSCCPRCWGHEVPGRREFDAKHEEQIINRHVFSAMTVTVRKDKME